jgi:hypothetical protein
MKIINESDIPTPAFPSESPYYLFIHYLNYNTSCKLGGPFEKFVDWRQCAAVMPTVVVGVT